MGIITKPLTQQENITMRDKRMRRIQTHLIEARRNGITSIGCDDDNHIGAIATLMNRASIIAPTLQHSGIHHHLIRMIHDAARQFRQRGDSFDAGDIGRQARKQRRMGLRQQMSGMGHRLIP